MLAYLVRVCWSAAAGQLHLASISDSQPPSPAQHHRGNRETTPTSSSSLEVEGSSGHISQLRAGLCLQQRADSVSSKVRDDIHTSDSHTYRLAHTHTHTHTHTHWTCCLSQNAAIAREALELLVTCLKLRPHLLNMFYTLPHIGDFIIDILVGSPHLQIRLSVVEQLLQLCSVNTVNTGEGGGVSHDGSCDCHVISSFSFTCIGVNAYQES